MKFRTPPEWPPAPDGWVPDPGWQPDATWPAAPRGWDFWVNDYGVPVEAPAGLYGGKMPRLRWTRRVLTGVGVFFALLLGIGIGGSSPADSTTAAGLLDQPTHTVTLSPAPAPTVTMTSPPETVTLPVETVTLPVETVTVEVAPKATAAAPLVPQQPRTTAAAQAAPAPAPAPAAPAKTTSAETSECVIKGNISSSGEKIYHVPGGGSYAATKIDLSKGERWFCSEQAARDAGWRKARN